MAGWDDAAPLPRAAAADMPGQDSGWDSPPAGLPLQTLAAEGDRADHTPAPFHDGTILLGSVPDPDTLRAALMASSPEKPPRLDASEVKHLSMPALQIMLAAMRETAGGGRVVIQDPSFALNLAFEAFGFVGTDEPFTVEYS
ncbi:MAG: hypothetical protein IOC90_04435 [Methylocystis sp.]|jgi:hypothetical protein|nr:hypothetical protein [Methylocystis sp.]MCA3582150.1 hypothetical protein [Methylocystis sp.]MCA3587264.1 hypothetical protein [Methylocystis sp.]MCA3590211.1 hypothetical protein [Methylocystis sp.]